MSRNSSPPTLRQCVGRAEHLQCAIGEFLQNGVARIVTECVVDVFETIQVDAEESELRTIAGKGAQGLHEPVFKEDAIRQSREWIMVGQVGKLMRQFAVLAGYGCEFCDRLKQRAPTH